MSVRRKIEASLDGINESSKRVISVNFDEGLLEQIDWVLNGFLQLGRNCTRNALIEEAVEAYIEEAQEIIAERLPVPEDFDMAIFPARNPGFKEVFLGENQWYAIRINAERIPSIKYVACYRAAPVSGITHYAEVELIDDYEDEPNKKIVYFKGSAIELPKRVSLGTTKETAMRSPRYTTLQKLLEANEIIDLF